MKTNAFEILKLKGLSSTAELRRASERSRVRQSMSTEATPDASVRVIERLLGDPNYRLTEAAAWYFALPSGEEAQLAPAEVLPHDEVVERWHRFCEETGQEFDPEQLEEICEATSNLLNNPMAWQPLEGLLHEIADARVNAQAIAGMAQRAAASWIFEGLLAVVSLGSEEVEEAAQIILDTENLPEEVLNLVTQAVLEEAADHLEAAVAEFESRAGPLMERIPEDSSVANSLKTTAETLASSARPWAALVDAFDDDPYSGREGHALDEIGLLLRGASIALANHVDDYTGAYRLIGLANEIAQSVSLKSSLAQDERRVEYVKACQEMIDAIQKRDLFRAQGNLFEAQALAANDEERSELAQFALLIQRLQLALGNQSRRVAATSGSGCGSIIGSIIGVIVLFGIVAGVIGAIVGSGEDSSSGSGHGDANAGIAPVSFDDSGNDSSDSERLAIEREQSRLADVASDLDDLATQIDQLSASLERTKALYPNGAPNYIIDQYEADRRRHNNLVREYNTTLSDYQGDVDALNRRIDAYNTR